jgi:hypothetical protein
MEKQKVNKRKYVKRKQKMVRAQRSILSNYRQPLYVKRTQKIDSFAVNTFGVGKGYSFTLNALTNNSDFTNLFDSYQIKGVSLKIIPSANSQETGTARYIPRIAFRWDYNDAATPANEQELIECDNVKVKNGLNIIKTYSRPRPQIALYGPISTGYGETKKMWISTSSTNVPHYGFKMFISQANNTYTADLDIYATYYLKFKNAK